MPRKYYHSSTVETKKKKKKEVLVFFEPEEGVHKCNQLFEENESRASVGDSPIYLFLDVDNKTWNLRVGLEFVRIRCCPYCFEKFEEK